MKKQILAAIALVAATFSMNAQTSDFWDRTSLEGSYGFAIPLAPTDNIDAADYSSMVNFQGAVHYQIDDLWGVRASYAYHKFENKDFSTLGVAYHKFMAEATFNVLEAINPKTSTLENKLWEVVAHAGFGGSFATRNMDNATNKMGNVQIGLQPMYSISNRVGVFLDATYVVNFNHAYEFDGTFIPGATTGGYFTTLVGVKISLGE